MTESMGRRTLQKVAESHTLRHSLMFVKKMNSERLRIGDRNETNRSEAGWFLDTSFVLQKRDSRLFSFHQTACPGISKNREHLAMKHCVDSKPRLTTLFTHLSCSVCLTFRFFLYPTHQYNRNTVIAEYSAVLLQVVNLFDRKHGT